MVRTLGFHSGNRGSIPLRATNTNTCFLAGVCICSREARIEPEGRFGNREVSTFLPGRAHERAEALS